MKKQGYFSIISRFLKRMLLAEVSLFIVVGLICWFVGWRTAHLYGYGLMWVGIIMILLGLFSVPGSYETWSFAYQYTWPGQVNYPYKHPSHRWLGTAQHQNLPILLSVVGGVSAACGTLLQTTFV